jgi:hypothetical protein
MANVGLEEDYEDNEPTPMVGSRRDSKDTHTAEDDYSLQVVPQNVGNLVQPYSQRQTGHPLSSYVPLCHVARFNQILHQQPLIHYKAVRDCPRSAVRPGGNSHPPCTGTCRQQEGHLGASALGLCGGMILTYVQR